MSRLQPRSFSSSASSRANELLDEFKYHLGSGTLWPELAHQLLDELQRQPVPVSARALNGLFAALADAPPSANCTDGPALAINLFNRHRISPDIYTYNILIECCHRACRPDLGPAFFGRLLKTGVTMSVITYSSYGESFGVDPLPSASSSSYGESFCSPGLGVDGTLVSCSFLKAAAGNSSWWRGCWWRGGFGLLLGAAPCFAGPADGFFGGAVLHPFIDGDGS
uniref:Restorer of fertility-like protein n=1 Tax=Triticum aestivum TaxID=4565 RepID=A0A7S5RZ46_WHEAT|nr:restorer of fertility-like protein [Triticum aestivum]QIP66529.1 restorer of fertility-like protein [Triticum aestivum]